MYSVSENYINKMFDSIQTHKLSGTVDGVSFSESDVIGVSYSNQCAEKKVSLGSVYIGTLKLTFLSDILNRGEYYGKTLTLTDSLYLGLDENEEPVWESVPIGVFYIAEATWTAAGIDITAYDSLSKFDTGLNIDQTSASIYSFCSFLATETGVQFGMIQEEVEALPNGTEVLGIFEENNLETCRDLLSALAQMVGGFAYAGKDGKFYLRPFDDSSVLTVPKNRRMSGSSFSDFETYYDTVCYTDIEAKEVRYFGDDEGLTMNLGSQPLMQLGTYSAKSRRGNAIANSIKRMKYTPFKFSMLPAAIALDLGDVVTLTDDHSGDVSIGAIMYIAWTYNKTFTVACYGDNPNLRSGQSATDKNIAGLINNTNQNEVTYYNFTNLSPIVVEPDVETEIASLSFYAAQTTTVKIMHEFLMDLVKDLSIDGSYEIRYYLDNELLTYKPRESLGALVGTVEVPIVPEPEEGEEPTEEKQVQWEDAELSITRDLFYVIRDVAPNLRHTWQVKILTHGIESLEIDTQNAHISLEGQRLYGSEYWGGQIEVRENINRIALVGMGVKALTESIVLDVENAETITVSDNVTAIDLGALAVLTLSESIQVIKTWLPLATEDHILVKTEDGLLIRIEL